MAWQFQFDIYACSTMQGNREVPRSLDPGQLGQASQFADGVRQLLGDDSEPDPQFFEESWSIGIPAALTNWYLRQRSQVDRERERHALTQPDNVGSLVLVRQKEWSVQHFLSAHAAVIAGRHDACRPRLSSKESAARTGYQRMQEQTTLAEEYDSGQSALNPMTELGACRILGVTPTSTREQVRVAYRRLVGRWHPDRLERGQEEVRRHATEQMAAINEAYRLIARRSIP